MHFSIIYPSKLNAIGWKPKATCDLQGGDGSRSPTPSPYLDPTIGDVAFQYCKSFTYSHQITHSKNNFHLQSYLTYLSSINIKFIIKLV